MSQNHYSIPKDIWDECIYIIRGYDSLLMEYESQIQTSPSTPTGQPKARSPSSPTERAGINRALMAIKLNAVDEAFTIIPPEYSQAIRDNIVKRIQYPDYAGRRTFVRWKARMIKYLAEKLLLI